MVAEVLEEAESAEAPAVARVPLMASGGPASLRWLTANLDGVWAGTARGQKVLGAFLDRATAEGARVVRAEGAPVTIEWPDGTSVSIRALALGLMDWPARAPVH